MSAAFQHGHGPHADAAADGAALLIVSVIRIPAIAMITIANSEAGT